jgi:hypothetical protein
LGLRALGLRALGFVVLSGARAGALATAGGTPGLDSRAAVRVVDRRFK